MRRWVLVCVVVCALGGVNAARGDSDFQIGVGYSHVELDGETFDGRGGLRLEPRFSFGLEALPQVRLGFAVGFSTYWKDFDDEDLIEVDGDTIFIEDDGVEGLTLFTPEFQLSWRQPLGRRYERGLYIEAGVGVGGVIGNYFVADEWGWDTEESDWDAAFSVRPFVRGAYEWDQFQVGIEGSYLFGQELDFNDRASGEVSEWYVGAFFGYRF